MIIPIGWATENWMALIPGIPALAILFISLFSGDWKKLDYKEIGIAVLLVSGLIGATAFSINPQVSWRLIAWPATAAVVGISIVLSGGCRKQTLILGLIGMISIIGLDSLYETITQETFFNVLKAKGYTLNQPIGSLGYPNASAVISCSLVFFLSMTFNYSITKEKLKSLNHLTLISISLGLLAISIRALHISNSRTAALCLLVGTMVACMAGLWKRKKNPMPWILSTALLMTSVQIFNNKENPLEALSKANQSQISHIPLMKFKKDSNQESNNIQNKKMEQLTGNRWKIYRVAADMFIERPITGQGLGGFHEQAHARWRQKYGEDTRYRYAHNLYLGSLAEGGILLFGGFFSSMLLGIFRSLKSCISINKTNGFWWNIGILTSMISCATFMIPDGRLTWSWSILFPSIFIAQAIGSYKNKHQC